MKAHSLSIVVFGGHILKIDLSRLTIFSLCTVAQKKCYFYKKLVVSFDKNKMFI